MALLLSFSKDTAFYNESHLHRQAVNTDSQLTLYAGGRGLVAVGEVIDIVGKTYDQLLPYVQPNIPAFRIIQGDFVTITE